MKVLFYSGVFARAGGIEEFTKDLSLVLSAEGIETEIVCATLENSILDSLAQSDVKITRIPVYKGCRWNIPDYALLPVAWIRMRNADLVIHQKSFTRWFYPLLPRRPKHIYLTAYRPKEQFCFPDAAARFFSFFDGILTQTEQFREDLRDMGVICPVHVLPLIPPSATPEVKDRTHSDGVVRVGIMGRLAEQKNPLYALEIAVALQNGLPKGVREIEFHVYGTGSLLPQLRERVDAVGLSAVFHNAYNRTEVPEIVQDNDLFLITSISEGQCIVALEVLAGGRPVFATPIGALPEILSEPVRGAVLPVSDAPAAAECIRDWLDAHSNMTADIIQQSYLRDYDHTLVRNRYVELIKNIAQET